MVGIRARDGEIENPIDGIVCDVLGSLIYEYRREICNSRRANEKRGRIGSAATGGWVYNGHLGRADCCDVSRGDRGLQTGT